VAIWARTADSTCGNMAKAGATQAVMQAMIFASPPFSHLSQFLPEAPMSDAMAILAAMTPA
jgi:hypothetical protein